MPTKKIVFIIMCSLLAVMLILSVVTVFMLTGLIGTPPQPNPDGTSASGTPTEGSQSPTNSPTDSSGNIHTHSYTVSKKVSATCTEDGYTIYECSCGDREIRDSVSAYGHTYGSSSLIAPTCTEKGYTQRVCSRCKHAEKWAYTDATGVHIFTLTEQHPATCTDDAFKVSKCSTCGKTNTEVDSGTAKGHKFEIWSGEKCSCSHNCGVSIGAGELAIQNDFMPGSALGSGVHYTVEVGTTTMRQLFTYNVDDYRSENEREANPLDIQYSTAEGLVITYTDAEGSQRIVLDRLSDGLHIIPAEQEGPQQPTTEAPEEAPTSPTSPTESNPDETERL